MDVAEPLQSWARWFGVTPLHTTLQFVGALLWLVLPGQWLVWAWTPPGKLRTWLVVWGLGASLAWLGLMAVLLHVFGGLHVAGWLAALALWMVAALAWRYRRTGRPWPLRLPDRSRRALTAWAARVRPIAPSLAFTVAALLLAFGIARQGGEEAAARPMTEFWVKSAGQQLVIGVRNREGRNLGYRIEIRAGMKVLQSLRVEPLRAGEQRELTIARPRDPGDPVSILQVPLYRDGDLLPYRHLTLAR